MSTVEEIASELVRIPSVNPDGGDPGTDQTGEAACAEWVARFLQECGAEVSLREVLPGRPNVVGRFPSKKSQAPRILFAPHLDTVSVSGMTVDPFGGEIREGRLWGRGASDTKGPMASMLWALREAKGFLADLKSGSRDSSAKRPANTEPRRSPKRRSSILSWPGSRLPSMQSTRTRVPVGCISKLEAVLSMRLDPRRA